MFLKPALQKDILNETYFETQLLGNTASHHKYVHSPSSFKLSDSDHKVNNTRDASLNSGFALSTGASHKIGILLFLTIAQENADQYFWNFVQSFCAILCALCMLSFKITI